MSDEAVLTKAQLATLGQKLLDQRHKKRLRQAAYRKSMREQGKKQLTMWYDRKKADALTAQGLEPVLAFAKPKDMKGMEQVPILLSNGHTWSVQWH
jgi:hypothetical protein